MKGKGKRRKAGLNQSILSVGFGTLNQMLTYKIEQKGGLVLQIPTQTVKPSQRCPKCGVVHQDWADLNNRCHVCKDSVPLVRTAGGFAIPIASAGRSPWDRGSTMVLYNVATNQQPGYGFATQAMEASSVLDVLALLPSPDTAPGAEEETKIPPSSRWGNPVRLYGGVVHGDRDDRI
ncbi:zinc ribbon domain-containing protein [Parathermosynechococcus lividus]